MKESSLDRRLCLKPHTFVALPCEKHHTETALRKDKLNRRVVAMGVLKLIHHIAVKRFAIWIPVCHNIEAPWHFLPFIFSHHPWGSWGACAVLQCCSVCVWHRMLSELPVTVCKLLTVFSNNSAQFVRQQPLTDRQTCSSGSCRAFGALKVHKTPAQAFSRQKHWMLHGFTDHSRFQ